MLLEMILSVYVYVRINENKNIHAVRILFISTLTQSVVFIFNQYRYKILPITVPLTVY